MMVGLYRNNSGAFAGDMNKLRAGATLDIARRRRRAQHSAARRAGHRARQVKDWRNYGAGWRRRRRRCTSARPRQNRTPPSDASAEVAPQDNKDGVLKLKQRPTANPAKNARPTGRRTGQPRKSPERRQRTHHHAGSPAGRNARPAGIALANGRRSRKTNQKPKPARLKPAASGIRRSSQCQRRPA